MIKKLVLVILLLGLASLLVPSLRERSQPHIDEFRVWLGGKLEGPMSPVLNRYRKLKTESQIGKATTELVRRRNMGAPPPEPDEIAEFMTRHEFSLDGLDAWGSPILLRQSPDSLTLVSPGPDIEYDTADDISRSIQYRDPARRRRGPRR